MAFTPRSFYAKQEYSNKLFVNCKDAFKVELEDVSKTLPADIQKYILTKTAT